MAKLLELDDYLLVNVVLAFLVVNFDLAIGTIYVIFSMIDWVAYLIALRSNVFTPIPVERDSRTRFTSLVWAMGLYVAFIFAVNLLQSNLFIASDLSAFEKISELVAATFSATPILFGSDIIQLMVFGVLIPIVETRFFFRTLMQWGITSAGFKLPTNVFSGTAFAIMAFFGAIFTIFHLVAKGVTDNAALLVTFIFGALSIGMVIHFREVSQAIFLHIITNSIATMQKLGIGFFQGAQAEFVAGIPILAGLMLVSWFLLFQQIPFLNRLKVRF